MADDLQLLRDYAATQSGEAFETPVSRYVNLVYSAAMRQQLSSYAMNGAIIGYDVMLDPPLKTAALRPDDCAFWETDETDPFYFNDGANFPAEGVSGRHQQGAIQAAFDGSVSYIRLNTWLQFVADTNRNRLWCYPNSPDGR